MKAAVATGDDDQFERLDVVYHHLIAEMSHSEILQYLGDIVFDTLLEEFIRLVPHTPAGWQRHAEVCTAIRARDPERSERAMQSLLDATAAYIT